MLNEALVWRMHALDQVVITVALVRSLLSSSTAEDMTHYDYKSYKRYLKPLDWLEPSDFASALFNDSRCSLNT